LKRFKEDQTLEEKETLSDCFFDQANSIALPLMSLSNVKEFSPSSLSSDRNLAVARFTGFHQYS